MQYVKFGKTGAEVSEMCLGTMMFGRSVDEAGSKAIMHRALEGGVNFLDTAAGYGEQAGDTEVIVGRAIRDRRDEVFLATKVHKGVDAASILDSIDESLARLDTDYVDLYQIHWPRTGMRIPEIMEALDRVVKAGKARFVGCSNYPAWVLEASNGYAGLKNLAPMVSNQIPYNLIERGVEVEVLPMASAKNIAIMTYRPIAIGLLAGKYIPGEPIPKDSRGQTSDRIRGWLAAYGDGILKLRDFAQRNGVSMLDVSIAWLRACPAVTCPIVGVSSMEQLETNLKAFEFTLSPEERDEVGGFFDTEVKEVCGGNYGPLRRDLDLVAPTE
jgi:aryl-alcohol dehydrogenase-like predicted oxidoreductase